MFVCQIGQSSHSRAQQDLGLTRNVGHCENPLPMPQHAEAFVGIWPELKRV